MIQILTLIVMAYLFGAISFAIIAAKIFKFQDPRQAGSKNPGATNVLRLGGKKAAIFVMVGDVAKGIIPILVAKALGISEFFQGVIGLAAVIGHIFPIYYLFSGGKGVATMLGVLFALNLGLGLTASVTWLIVAFIFRYSSLASVVMILAVPSYAYWFKLHALIPSLLILVGIVLICHRGNIKRLVLGQESKIGSGH